MLHTGFPHTISPTVPLVCTLGLNRYIQLDLINRLIDSAQDKINYIFVKAPISKTYVYDVYVRFRHKHVVHTNQWGRWAHCVCITMRNWPKCLYICIDLQFCFVAFNSFFLQFHKHLLTLFDSLSVISLVNTLVVFAPTHAPPHALPSCNTRKCTARMPSWESLAHAHLVSLWQTVSPLLNLPHLL